MRQRGGECHPQRGCMSHWRAAGPTATTNRPRGPQALDLSDLGALEAGLAAALAQLPHRLEGGAYRCGAAGRVQRPA